MLKGANISIWICQVHVPNSPSLRTVESQLLFSPISVSRLTHLWIQPNRVVVSVTMPVHSQHQRHVSVAAPPGSGLRPVLRNEHDDLEGVLLGGAAPAHVERMVQAV
jgi:hypothetical protein